MSDALGLDALLVQIAAEVDRARAHARRVGLELGPVDVTLHGDVGADLAFSPDGDGLVAMRLVPAVLHGGASPPAPTLAGLTRSAAMRAARASGASLVVVPVPVLAARDRGRVAWQRPAPGEPLVDRRVVVGLGE